MASNRYVMHKPPAATMTLTVAPSRRYVLRMWLALKLFRLGAWVIGWRVEVEKGDG